VQDATVQDAAVQDATVQLHSEPLIIELRPALWMVKDEGRDGGPGVIRGYLSTVEAPDGIRYLARLPHLNPTQGIRLGEFWEWERAVEAILAEQPRPLVADPYRDLRYTEPGENVERLEKSRQRRRFAGRFR
jgi:hypothetical protein